MRYLRFKWIALLAVIIGATGAVVALLPAESQNRPAAAAATPTKPQAQPSTEQSQSPPVGAASGQAEAPEVTTATYGAWTLRCARAKSPGDTTKNCQISETLAAQQGGGAIAQIIFARAPKIGSENALRGAVILPNNIAIEVAPKIASVENDPASLALIWRRCLPVGCVAEGDVATGQLDPFRRGDHPGRIEFADGSDRKLAITFPTEGFSQALDALLAN